MRADLLALHRHPAVRFVFVGGINTVSTALLVVVLSYILPGWLAFTLSFGLGLIFSVILTGKWVFDSHLTRRRAFMFGGSYLVVYVIGIAFVSLMHVLDAPAWANGASVFITAPLSFFAGKLIFTEHTAPSASRSPRVDTTEGTSN